MVRRRLEPFLRQAPDPQRRFTRVNDSIGATTLPGAGRRLNQRDGGTAGRLHRTHVARC
jgi:hypothetical protein